MYLGSVKAEAHQCDVHCVVEGQSDALSKVFYNFGLEMIFGTG